MPITLAAKCAPEERYLSAVAEAGLEAVELYLTATMLRNPQALGELCLPYPLRYALHAPTEGFLPAELAALASALHASVVVFHDIYWEDEWSALLKAFEGLPARLCVENTRSVHEPIKFMRRYGMGRCLDLEHLQQECGGIFEEEFLRVMKQASHIHLTGYSWGSELWHTHIHQSPEQSLRFMRLLRDVGYSGMVVSEARTSLQSPDEFKRLREFSLRMEQSMP